MATKLGELFVVERLLNEGHDVNERGAHGETPLMIGNFMQQIILVF